MTNDVNEVNDFFWKRRAHKLEVSMQEAIIENDFIVSGALIKYNVPLL